MVICLFVLVSFGHFIGCHSSISDSFGIFKLSLKHSYSVAINQVTVATVKLSK
jgi:hypothetical protein